MTSAQLPFEVFLRGDATFNNFFPGDSLTNQEALVTLSRVNSPFSEKYCYLWGSSGVGKSHLLQATIHRASAHQLSGLYLPLSQELIHAQQPNLVFQGLDKLNVVCVDNLNLLAGEPIWEEAFFHLYNKMRENNQTRLMIAATCSPQALGVKLADLSSRLAWGLTIHLDPLKDDEKLEAIQIHAKDIGMELPEEVGRYLLSRVTRNMSHLNAVLNQLSKASIVNQRKLTIPFVKSIIK